MLAFQTAGGGDIHLRRNGVGQLGKGRVGVGFILEGRTAENVNELILLGVEITQPCQPAQAAVWPTKTRHRLHVHLFSADIGVRQGISRRTVNIEVGINNAVFQRQAVGLLPGQIPNAAVGVAFKHRSARIVAQAGRVNQRVEALVLR
ncbi:hypothetical protein D3C78_1268840 [compost metagenome]